MNNEAREYTGFIPTDTYSRDNLVRRLRQIGFTDNARVEFPGNQSVNSLGQSNSLLLEGRFPETFKFSFRAEVVQPGKAVLIFGYEPEANGYFYLGNRLIAKPF